MYLNLVRTWSEACAAMVVEELNVKALQFVEAVATWADYIKAETLSTALVTAAPPPEAYTETHTIDGMTITLGVQ
jgi:hypothetical protein